MQRASPSARRLWWIATLAWLLVIGWLTLRSAPDQVRQVALLRWNCVVCGDAGVADILLNVLLFVPLGLGARALGASVWRTLAFVVPLTIGIETTQGLILIGRDASLGDVLTNSTGGVVGWLGYTLLVALKAPSRIVAWRGAAAMVGLTTSIWIATAFGIRPALSDAAPFGIDTPLGPARGLPIAVQSVSIGGVELSSDTPGAPGAPAVPQHDSLEITAVVTRTGDVLPAHSAPFVRVVDSGWRPQVSLSLRGTDLVAEAQLRASRWLLHTPQWQFPDGLALPLQRPTELRVRWTRDNVMLRIGNASAPVAALRLSVALGWIFIHPFVSTVSDSAAFWSYLWLAWWFGVSGWLGGALGPRVAGFVGALQLFAMLVVATVTATPWHGDELAVAAFAYAAVAAVAHWRAARRQRGARETATP
jgi:hypothetical protein